MVNGDGTAERRDESARKIDTEPKGTLETKAANPLSPSSEEPDAWVPKPVVITANNAANVPEDNDVDSSNFSAQNVSGGKNPAYFQNATLTSPIDDVESDEGNGGDEENDGEESDEAEKADDESVKKTEDKKTEDEKAETPAEGESVSSDLRIHSSYLAAASPEKSPLDSDAPSYDIKEKSAYSCALTNAKSVEGAF